MKIVILTAVFPPEGIGGTEIAAYNLAKTLAKKGNEVHVVSSGYKTGPEEFTEDGFLVHRIFYPRLPYLGIIYFWLKVPFCIKKINPDIVHCQSTQMGLSCFLAKKISKKPYVVWGQGSDIYLPWKFKKIISGLALNNADAVVALTEDMKAKIQENYKNDIFVIPNGVNLEDFNNLPKIAASVALETDPFEKIVLFAGSLQEVKGLRYLLGALNIIKNKLPEVKLILVGDGNERRGLEQIVQQNVLSGKVIFTGKVPNSQIPEYMAAADVFVLPSLSEGLPLVILEAMASGLPVVATRVGGIPELIKEGENGFLVEPENPGQIAEKILYLLSSESLRKNIGLNNKKKVKNYSWDLVTDKLMNIYSNCLKNEQ